MEEFKGFNHNIPDDIETVFDVCDKKHLEYAKKITHADNKTIYLSRLKDRNACIDEIYGDIAIYYKDFQHNKDKCDTVLKKINPYYLADFSKVLKYSDILSRFFDFR